MNDEKPHTRDCELLRSDVYKWKQHFIHRSNSENRDNNNYVEKERNFAVFVWFLQEDEKENRDFEHRGLEQGENYLLPSPYPFPGRKEYSPVEEQYHQQWDVETGRGGEYLIAHVLRNDALQILVDSGFPFRIFPPKQRCYRDQHGQGPDHDDHVAYPSGRSLVGVVDVRYGPVSEG